MSEGIHKVWRVDLAQMAQNTWWPCYEPKTTDDVAGQLAAAKLGCTPEQVQIKRTGGAVLARRKATT